MLFEGPKGKLLLFVLLALVGSVGLYLSTTYILDKATQRVDNVVPQTSASTFIVHYANSLVDSTDCGITQGITRYNPNANVSVEDVLKELFAGPSKEEQSEGYTSFFLNNQNILNWAKIENNIAYINFKDIREEFSSKGANTSCGSEAFHSSIKNTLADKFGISDVYYALDGDPLAYYEWMQVGCAPQESRCNPQPFNN